jgi:2-iminobutanoate/2-iminopropanoate deaminase
MRNEGERDMLKECVDLKKNKMHTPSSDGLRLGDFIWIGGQYPIDPVTSEMADLNIRAQTEQAMKNVIAALKKYELETCHIMHTTIYMTDISQYDAMNEVYASFFHDCFPARSVVGVKELPHHAMIEIECNALDTRALEVLCHEDDEEENTSCCSKGICE